MNTTVLMLLFLVGFSPSLVLSQAPRVPQNATHYYKLAIQWAYSVCNSGNTTCNPPNPYYTIPHPEYRFTIHGFWPDYYPRTLAPPQYCHNISYTQIHQRNLLANMEHFWPNIVRKGGDVGFWIVQWLKHGTCAVPLMTQNLFFSKALVLLRRLDQDNSILKEVHIGTNEKNVSILLQENPLVGVFPEVECNENPHTHKMQLKQIRVCYDLPSDSWINCPYAFNSCPDEYELPD